MTKRTDANLLVEVENFLETSEAESVTGAPSLVEVAQQVKEAVDTVYATLEKAADSLTEPLQGDALERYKALIDASSAHLKAWQELADIADILMNCGHELRFSRSRMIERIRAYSDVFGFEIPDELKPDSTDSANPFAPEDVPF